MIKPKPVVVIENAQVAPVGRVGQIMEEQGIAYEVVNAEKAKKLPLPEDAAAVVVLGGPQHVDNPDQYPYFIEEEQFIQRATGQDIPYLGICLGGQLLAHVLGAHVGRHHTLEVGFSHVQLTEQGINDPLFHGLPNPQLVFHWHVDAFHLPKNAVLLATSADVPNQAFRYGRRAYGLQYHVEILPEIFEHWLRTETRELVDALGPEAISGLSDEWNRHYAAYRQQSTLMIYNFLRMAELV